MTQHGKDVAFSGTLASRHPATYDAAEHTLTFDYKDNTGFEYYFVYALG